MLDIIALGRGYSYEYRKNIRDLHDIRNCFVIEIIITREFDEFEMTSMNCIF